MELAASLEVQTLVLLDRHQWKSQQIWSAGNVSLELDEHWLMCLQVSLYLDACHHNFFVIVADVEWANQAVVRPLDGECCPLGHYQVHIIELFPTLDNSCHELVLVQLLKSIIEPPFSDRIEIDFCFGIRALSDVLLSHLLREDLHAVGQLWVDIVPVRSMHLGHTSWWSK